MNDHVRFSDPKLEKFYQEFIEHAAEEQADRKAMTDAIDKLAETVQILSNSTKDMVEVWNAGQGVLRFGAALAKFAKWLSTIAIFGAVFAYAFKKFGG